MSFNPAGMSAAVNILPAMHLRSSVVRKVKCPVTGKAFSLYLSHASSESQVSLLFCLSVAVKNSLLFMALGLIPKQ